MRGAARYGIYEIDSLNDTDENGMIKFKSIADQLGTKSVPYYISQIDGMIFLTEIPGEDSRIIQVELRNGSLRQKDVLFESNPAFIDRVIRAKKSPYPV